MNPTVYRKFCGTNPMTGKLGGCELLIPEIVSYLFGNVKKVYLPFKQTQTLPHVLEQWGIPCKVGNDNVRDPDRCYIHKWQRYIMDGCEAIYFGTPTIVNDRPLFDGEVSRDWNKQKERNYVRRLCQMCKESGMKYILSGLGTGDISQQERCDDMGGASLLTFKAFDEFDDYLLVWRLET